MRDRINSITFIGAGNVAWHLARAFYKKGMKIDLVFSRSVDSAKQLASSVSAGSTNNLSEIGNISDLYIIALTDDVIHEIPEKVRFDNKLVVHTAGSVPVSVFEGKLKNYGVLYPLQTFSKSRELDVSKIPFCIEANNEKNLKLLSKTAALLSHSVYEIDSEARKKLHLAAVVAGNFTNHMYGLAENYLSKNQLSFDLLKPLILETAVKAGEMSPLDAQTGPSVRNNTGVMHNHQHMLKEFPQLRKIYKLVSESINKLHTGDRH